MYTYYQLPQLHTLQLFVRAHYEALRARDLMVHSQAANSGEHTQVASADRADLATALLHTGPVQEDNQHRHRYLLLSWGGAQLTGRPKI